MDILLKRNKDYYVGHSCNKTIEASSKLLWPKNVGSTEILFFPEMVCGGANLVALIFVLVATPRAVCAANKKISMIEAVLAYKFS